jgi:hypothetical protein
MRRAVHALAGQAELLAVAMEFGELRDRGGPDALRLFAAVALISADTSGQVVGHA